jgi:beta-glucosidase
LDTELSEEEALRARASTIFAAISLGSDDEELHIGDQEADAFADMLRRHPAATRARPLDATVDVLGHDLYDEATARRRELSAAILAGGAFALSRARDSQDLDSMADALVHVSIGATPIDELLRAALTGHGYPFLDPLRDPAEPDELPPLNDLADDIDAKGCAAQAKRAIAELGKSIKAAKEVTFTADADGISGIVPSQVCPGDVIRITGDGFGDKQPSTVEVLVPTRRGKCTAVAPTAWSDTEITVVAPPEIGPGAIGFRRRHGEFSGPPPLPSAATNAADVMIACFGYAAAAAAAAISHFNFLPDLPCAPGNAGDTNFLTGGRPEIVSFTVQDTDSASLVGGDPFTISWMVDNADYVTVARLAYADTRNQLPDIPGQRPSVGEYAHPAVRSSYPWTGIYELQAHNACTGALPETATVEIRAEPYREDFLWGVGTAGYQVEGGITNNDWHSFMSDVPTVGRVISLGVLAGVGFDPRPAGPAIGQESISIIQADLDRAKTLGCNAYRFSVEWSRVEPQDGSFDDAVLNSYYVRIAQEIRSRRMVPIVTLNHLTLPAWVCTPPRGWSASGDDPNFQASLRGWETTETVDRYVRYVDHVARVLRADLWLTMNEPVGSMVGAGYLGGVWPPGFVLDSDRGRSAYFNLIKAHVRAYDAIKAIQPHARVSFAHNMPYIRRVSDPGNWNLNGYAANQMDYFYNWHMLDAVTSGQVDVNIAHRPGDRSYESSQKFFGIAARDWRPKLDFLGVNYYRGVYAYWDAIAAIKLPYVLGRWDEDLSNSKETHGIATDIGWEVLPEGLAATLERVHADYNLPVLISENGIAERTDLSRAAYIVAHIEQIRRAQNAGVNVLGYIHWTLADNYEWAFSYLPLARFGLYAVDRTVDSSGNPRLRRRLNDGALALQFLASGGSVGDARDRFGSFSGNGQQMYFPNRSAGSLWTGAGQFTFALYLSLLNGNPPGNREGILGMVFYLADRMWHRLDEVTWDAGGNRVTLYHRPYGPIPEREFQGSLAGEVFSGTYIEGGYGSYKSPWTATRVRAHGNWQSSHYLLSQISVSNLGQWEGSGPGSNLWSAKTTFVSASALPAGWFTLSPATVVGSTISLGPFSCEVLTRDSMVIDGTAASGTGSIASRLPDDLPF